MRIQALMGAAGVLPFSGSLLVGALGPATTVAVGSSDAAVVAAAHAYLPHNAHSAHRDLDTTHVHELVSASNVPSRRMVESCGLRLEPGLVCGIAIAYNDSARFTR